MILSMLFTLSTLIGILFIFWWVIDRASIRIVDYLDVTFLSVQHSAGLGNAIWLIRLGASTGLSRPGSSRFLPRRRRRRFLRIFAAGNVLPLDLLLATHPATGEFLQNREVPLPRNQYGMIAHGNYVSY